MNQGDSWQRSGSQSLSQLAGAVGHADDLIADQGDPLVACGIRRVFQPLDLVACFRFGHRIGSRPTSIKETPRLLDLGMLGKAAGCVCYELTGRTQLAGLDMTSEPIEYLVGTDSRGGDVRFCDVGEN